MNRLFRLIDLTIYIFGCGRRRAWCELTGGHDNEILGSWAGHERAHAIKLHCFRCDHESSWLRVPDRKDHP
jgi:hypothetical protein